MDALQSIKSDPATGSHSPSPLRGEHSDVQRCTHFGSLAVYAFRPAKKRQCTACPRPWLRRLDDFSAGRDVPAAWALDKNYPMTLPPFVATRSHRVRRRVACYNRCVLRCDANVTRTITGRPTPAESETLPRVGEEIRNAPAGYMLIGGPRVIMRSLMRCADR
ncbi:hypothetical protein EVAR_8172_1 [Eumeta japonica]|uniref:Uncharacterized protein n=1 Tax=Eumeta variegata TaxID=151549 RepID=A0A4C1TFG6_EUMVA|nr:hypothetical protein EVAR_8172_1 [Eumeta japonica]